MPTVGNSGYEVTFTPTDNGNYNTKTQNVAVTVNKADPTITTPPTAATITYDPTKTLADVVLSGGNANIAGTFTWTTPATPVGNVGIHTYKATFTPGDASNYNVLTDIDVNITVVAEPTQIMITFDANGGNDVIPASAPTGTDGTLTSLPPATRAGYTFDGWFTLATGGIQVTESTPFTESTTIYAQWTLITYTITFDPNGGTVTPTQGTTVEGGVLASLPTPTRTGYSFDGWFTALTGGNQVTESTSFSANATIYAQWTPIDAETPVITAQPQGGSVTVGAAGATHPLTIAASVTDGGTLSYQWYRNTDASNTGGTLISGATSATYLAPIGSTETFYYYVVVTNTNNSAGGDKTAMVASAPVTLTVQEYQPFTVWFDPNGGSSSWDIRQTGPDGTLASLPTPTWEKHFFNGWFTMPVGGEKIVLGWKYEKDFVVFAQWTPSYTIRFNANGGDVTPDFVVTGEGRKLPLLILPEPDKRDGYEFGGWYTSRTGGTKILLDRVYSRDTTVYARWTLISYTITCKNVDGGFVSPPNPGGYTVETPTFTLNNPVKEGYFFEGWTGANGNTPQTSVEIEEGTTGHLEYTANWTPDAPVYTITFNSTGGMVTPGSAKTGSDRRLASLPEPAKSDSAFVGWYTAVTGGVLVTTGTEFSRDSTIYARWGTSYKVVFNANGGAVTPALARTGVGGRLASLPVPVRPGFTFIGWLSAAIDGMEIEANSTSFSSDNTIYARWVAVYTVTFSPSGGTVAPISCVTGVDGKISCTLPEPKRDGYDFDGWFTSVAGGEAVTEDRVYGANATVYAQWTLITYKISFDPNGGTVSAEPGVTGATWRLASLPTPKRDGWSFNGWFTAVDDGERVTTGTVFRADATIYAQWTLITYRITFNANGGSVSPAQGMTGEGGWLASLPNPARPGYIFDGWFTALTGGEEVTTGTAFTESATIYAGWTLIVYRINFDGNGGLVSTVTGETGVGGQLASLPEPERRPGWAFNGWFTARTGGTAVTTGTVFTADAVVYAQWAVVYVVTFNAAGGTVSPARDSTGAGGRLVSMPVPKRDGYDFGGWFSADSGSGTAVTSATVFTANDTVFARWGVSAPVPVITSQPRSGAVALGEAGATTALTVAASISDGEMSYQWYKNAAAAPINGTAIPDAEGASYAAPTDVAGTFYYYIIVANTIPDNGDGGRKTVELASSVATIRVEDPNAVLSHGRAVPAGNTGDVAVVAPVSQLTAVFSAGPNPVSRGSSRPAVTFFWQGKALAGGTLFVFDASGNLVNEVQVTDKAITPARRDIGAWNLADAKGRPVAPGTYLVKGVLSGRDGNKVKVSLVLGVR
jgi:uncharacterized repeat protein (TIGR02543 family)